MAGSDSGVPSLVRPKDAAISCSHFWANALLLAGISLFIVGTIIFVEWKGIGSFWVGASAAATGVAGIYVTQSQASGGVATGFYIFLSAVTLVAALVSLVLGDGLAWVVVRDTEGNCSNGNDCPASFCAADSCVCWAPDATQRCSEAGSRRYCMRYGGSSCSDIKDSQGILLGSFILLVLIALFSAFSLMVSISTCCYCKRTFVITDNATTEAPPAAFR